MSSPKNKYKAEKNAQQLKMTGIVVLNKDTNVVVVEGSQKQVAFYKRLMLIRIDWNEGLKKDKEEMEGECGEMLCFKELYSIQSTRARRSQTSAYLCGRAL